MDPEEIATYAKGIAAALRVIGPTPHERAIGMLRALQLSEDAARTVLAYALAHGLLVEDADAGQVRVAPPRRRATTSVAPRSVPYRPAARSGALGGAAPFVLLIETEDVLRAAMRAALEDEGHAVVAVADGAGAFELLAGGGRPSAVVVGVVMSVAEGIALVGRLRAVPACGLLPVVTISATHAPHPPPGTAFLAAPFTEAAMVQAVRNLLQPGSVALG